MMFLRGRINKIWGLNIKVERGRGVKDDWVF